MRIAILRAILVGMILGVALFWFFVVRDSTNTYYVSTNQTDDLIFEPKQIPSDTFEIAFVGDIMLDRFIRDNAEEKGYDYILEELTDVLRGYDVVIANLEGPVTTFDPVSTSDLNDPNHYKFTFDEKSLNMLYDNNIRIVSIDNNHILNFGNEGLEQTKRFLEDDTISYFGDPNDSASTLVADLDGRKIGFVSFNQFVSPNPEATVENILNLKQTADFVAVYAHWGDEYEKTPNEYQINLAHDWIDAGADIVIGSHPHVIQSKEIYNGKSIYYSLGNFIFDQYFSEDVRCGAMVSIQLGEDNTYKTKERFVYLNNYGSTSLSSCATEVPTNY
jgi:gamma-polyglutamate biosynthesis protein CapA